MWVVSLFMVLYVAPVCMDQNYYNILYLIVNATFSLK
jgi:hypothetical protein